MAHVLKFVWKRILPVLREIFQYMRANMADKNGT